jgi:hypothetical protein
MNQTKLWIMEQVSDYKRLISTLSNNELDNRLRTIWQTIINTLETTLKVIRIEEGAKQ